MPGTLPGMGIWGGATSREAQAGIRQMEKAAAGGPRSWGALYVGGACMGGRQGLCMQAVGSSPEAVRAGRGAEEQKGWRSRSSNPQGASVSVTSPRWNAAQEVAAVGRRAPGSSPPIPDVAVMMLLPAETGGQVAPE